MCVCVCIASQFCSLQCSLCNGTNVDASLLPALKPPDPAQGCSTMQVTHLLVSEVLFGLKLKHGVGKLPHYFLVSLNGNNKTVDVGLKLAPLWEQSHHRNNNNKDVVNNVNISTQGIWNRRHVSECQSPKNVSINLMHSGTQHTFLILLHLHRSN